MKNHRGFTILEALLILVIVGLLGGVGWYVWDSKDKTDKTYTDADAANSSVADYSNKETKGDIPAGYKKYENKELNFSLLYPQEWKESKSSGSSSNKEDVNFTSPDFKLKEDSAHGQLVSGGRFSVQAYKSDHNSVDEFKKGGAGVGSYHSGMVDMKISNLPALREKKCGHPVSYLDCVFVYKNELKYDISYAHTENETSDNAKYLKEFEKLLDTFRFTN